jgi:hypothetical protein
MRIEFAESTGCPFGQFVVHAEGSQDGAIIKAFPGGMRSESGNWRESGWEFCVHGNTYSDGRTRSFNFGWRETSSDPAPPARWTADPDLLAALKEMVNAYYDDGCDKEEDQPTMVIEAIRQIHRFDPFAVGPPFRAGPPPMPEPIDDDEIAF